MSKSIYFVITDVRAVPKHEELAEYIEEFPEFKGLDYKVEVLIEELGAMELPSVLCEVTTKDVGDVDSVYYCCRIDHGPDVDTDMAAAWGVGMAKDVVTLCGAIQSSDNPNLKYDDISPFMRTVIKGDTTILRNAATFGRESKPTAVIH